MRVLLLAIEQSIMSMEHPNYQKIVQLSEFKRREALWDCPNLSLLTIASHFPVFWTIDYVDLGYETLPDDEYDVVFISLTTAQAKRAYEVGDILRKRHVLVIMGGIHPSTMPKEVLQHADAICIGESENYLSQLIADVEKRELKQVYSDVTEVSLVNNPIPRYDLARKYPYRTIPVQITRGCPHACFFCASTAIYGSKRRCKDMDSINMTLDLIVKYWKYPYIFFTDDNLFIDDKYTLLILDVIKKYSVRWYAFADIGIAHKSYILGEMKKAGCQQLLIGFESLSEKCLGLINTSKWKQKKRYLYEESVQQIQSQMIGVVGSFILGLDGERESVFEDIEQFVEDTNMYATNITIATPFPGTKLYSQLSAEKRIFQYDWSHYNGFELTFKPEKWEINKFEDRYIDLQVKINRPERIQGMLEHLKMQFRERLLLVVGDDE